MNQKELNKELVEKLMKIEGECRGVCLKVDWEYILRKEGKKGLEKLETKMAELGFPLKYKEIKSMEFYPIGLEALSVLVIKDLFNYDEKDLEEMGAEAPKFSLVLKLFLSYFFSLRLLTEQAPKMWRKHYTIGDLEVSEINEKEKYAVIKLKNFSLHSSFCATLKGYFSRIVGMATKSSASAQETKCTFKGDQYHQFLIRWK